MPTPPLPPDDHVVRYVRGRLLRRDDDDNVLGVLPQAFEHREGEAYLSVTWLEHFDTEYEVGLRGAASAIRCQLIVKNRDGFTVGCVGVICELCSGFSLKVRLLHEPKPPENTGYCAWRGARDADLELLDLLAADAFTDTRVAADIP